MKNGYIFDLDGTIYLEDRAIEGASETIRALRERGDKVVFLTNKSIETTETYVNKLNELGIKVTKDTVINSNILTARYLKANIGNIDKVMVIGEDPLMNEIRSHGIEVSDNPEEVKYVVLGWDREFNYDKLNRAFQAWRNGAIVIATNPDRTCPMRGGQIPDCGAMIGAMEGATGEKVEIILGKPSLLAAKFIVEDILKLPSNKCYMVGDRLETDVKMGNDYGMNSVLVLTGITDRSMVETTPFKPHYTLNSVKDILSIKTDVVV
ncbi:HAD-IIA family hydrolase [Oceanobacillus sp. J11TS1]|uniref:HAD-IIA family hydrolase n=1 Tax=Oceanobacillus sp. J11TS1 TaxID=2807191 RepID=UPI001B0BD594|nr:HAD-IIA family hydrolase [Oceanobacillus sp. J11TS1]GIO24660.1 haloacid dehalogenase [Oceanobacillus sp. J11TS1]